MAYKQPYYQAYPSYTFPHQHDSRDDYPMQSSSGFSSHYHPYNNDKYQQHATPAAASKRGAVWNPRLWSRQTKIIAAIATAVGLIIIIVVAAVEGTKSSAYPDYKALSYSLDTSIEPGNFFDSYDYWTTYDPAQGFVHYDNTIDAKNRNLTFQTDNSAYLRVDTQGTDESTGRHSARVASKKSWNSGLFLFDIKHSPYGCATWPAVWLSDQSNWPNNGEIDVIEAVNQATSGVQSTLHSTKGCTMSVKRKQTGTVVGNDCWNETNANAGCGVTGPASTYGELFNNNGGGVYATEWRSAGIRIWFFPRASLPEDVSAAVSTEMNAGTPDPSKWGQPLADYPSTDCDVSSHFRNASIIANIDLCGQWAGRVYSDDKCPGNCQTYVAQNPAAFNNAFWEFGAFKVYKAAGEA